MKKKYIIGIVSIILAVTLFAVLYVYNSNIKTVKTVEENDKYVNENVDETKIAKANGTIEADLEDDLSKREVRNQNSENIVIATVKKIEGASNKDPKTGETTLIDTYGELEIITNIKGNIKEQTVPFVRTGGEMNYYDWYQNLRDAQKEKINTDPDMIKMTEEEMRNEKSVEYFSGDIYLEEGKTYLMYLVKYSSYNKYGIVFFEHGARELKKEKISELKKAKALLQNRSEEKTGIFVKNNITGEYEDLKDVI